MYLFIYLFIIFFYYLLLLNYKKKYPEMVSIEMETSQLLNLARLSKLEYRIHASAFAIIFANRTTNKFMVYQILIFLVIFKFLRIIFVSCIFYFFFRTQILCIKDK